MKTHSESPLAPNIIESLHGSNAEGAALVGVTLGDAPGVIVEAIDDFVFKWQCGTRPSKQVIDPEDAPYALGSLWGQQLVREFGWEWRMVTFHEHGNSKASGVLSPDRALAVYPIHFILGCLRDPNVDATIALSFNMLSAGEMGELEPAAYFNLMDGVQRIVPRIPEPPKQSWWKRITGKGR